MSLKHAILGLIHMQPMTGYDLKHLAFDQTVAHFWQADQAQIYRTLDHMEAEGWLTSAYTIQTDRPNKRVYSITAAGQVELLRWLHEEQPLPVHREPFLLQLFFAEALPDAVLLEQIAQQQQAHEARLAQYTAIPLPPLADPTLDRRQLLWRLTLEMGIALEQTYLAWLAQCAEALRQRSS